MQALSRRGGAWPAPILDDAGYVVGAMAALAPQAQRLSRPAGRRKGLVVAVARWRALARSRKPGVGRAGRATRRPLAERAPRALTTSSASVL